MIRAIIQLGFRGVLVLGIMSVAVSAYALRNLDQASTFGTFTTNGIDLKIDSKAWYNGASVPSATWALKNLNPGTDKFFNFDDVKPGDFGCNVISLHVKKGDAWLCLDFKHLTNNDAGVNEPESLVDANGNTSGELAAGLQFFGWIDDGDGKLETGEKPLFGTSTKTAAVVLNDKSYPIGDSKNYGSCRQNTTKYVGMCWCAGALTVNMNTGKMTCDGSTLGNAAQTDVVTVDVMIRTLSTTGDPKFLCNPPPPPPHIPKDHNECKNNGWKSCGDDRGSRFKNQNECSNYVTNHEKEKKNDKNKSDDRRDR